MKRESDKFTIEELEEIRISHRDKSNKQAAYDHGLTDWTLNNLVMENNWKKATIAEKKQEVVNQMLSDFPNMSNRELKENYGLSISYIQRHAADKGVKKSPEHIRKVRNTSRLGKTNKNSSKPENKKLISDKPKKKRTTKVNWPNGYNPILGY